MTIDFKTLINNILPHVLDSKFPVLLRGRHGIGKSTVVYQICLLYTSPSPRDATLSRMPSSA